MRVKAALLAVLALTQTHAQASLFTSGALNAAIPDGNPTGVFSTIDVSGLVPAADDVNVYINLSGGANGDLYAYLRFESGSVVLLNRIGKTSDDPFGSSSSGLGNGPVWFNFKLDDSGTADIHLYDGGSPITGVFQPDRRTADPQLVVDGDTRGVALNSLLSGGNPNGSWTLFLADMTGDLNAPTLVSWGVELNANPVPEPVNQALVALAGLGLAGALWRRKPWRRLAAAGAVVADSPAAPRVDGKKNSEVPDAGRRLPCWLLAFGLALGMAGSSQAVQIRSLTGTNVFFDASVNLHCDYIQYQVTNETSAGLTNLWVTIDSFSGTRIRLGGGDAGLHNLGNLASHAVSDTAYFYIRCTNTTTTAETHKVHIYQGYPGAGGVELTNQTFSLNVLGVGNNNANKVNAVKLTPSQPVLGATFVIEVDGATSTMNGGTDQLFFLPAANTNWSASGFDLIGTLMVLTNNSAPYFYTNRLLFPCPGSANKANDYVAQYFFRAVAVTGSSITNSPDGVFQTGGGWNHSTFSGVTIPPIPPPTNAMVLTNFASVTQLYTNEVVYITNRFYNSSAIDIYLDRVVDTMPAGFLYVTNSTTFNGSATANPVISGVSNTWSVPLLVPAGTTRDLVFRLMPTGTNTYVTNYTVAYIEDTLIDSTLSTADNRPGTNILRVLWEPIAVNDTGTTLEDQQLIVAAPGVLSNDAETNGFPMAVVGYTQPTHGSVTVNANGSYTYTPETNYFGGDSFTYTMTNGNARASTATVNLTITSVNDPPSFAKGLDQTVSEDSGVHSVSGWASSLSVGPANEAGQTLTFHPSNNNNSLFSSQPAVSSDGTLTFTPAADANGSATVTIYATDSGGTSDGGNDASATNTFTITVTAVNDPPSFTKGADQTVLEDSGAHSVSGWATSLSAGPANESSQTLTFHLSNNNNSLFSSQPDVSSDGKLTYTPAANANGSATVTVYLTDNGGTSNGGNDTSGTNTFTITVTAVNDPPTLDPIGNLTINESAGPQTVNFAGISAGPSDESGQTLTVQAFSSNTGLIPNPTVSYSTPQASGSLSFTPVASAIGASTITVVVQDNGGTANGGVDAVTNTFTVTVNPVTNIWAPDGSFAVDVNDANGPGGTGYTKTDYAGVLEIQATSGNPFIIDLATLSGGSPGLAANFDEDSNYEWTIATTTRGITGFSTDKFLVDTSHFSNDLAGGVFTVVSNSGAVALSFTPNQPPTAQPASYGRAWGTFLKIPIASLLADFTSDPDGDSRALELVSASTNHSWIATNGTHILFAPTNNIPESFGYVVRDVRDYRAGDTVRLATNYITVSVTNAVSYVQSIDTSGGGGVVVKFAGVPGYAYDVERAADVSGPWTVVFTTNAPAVGVFRYTDVEPPAPSAFYRLKQH